MTEAQWDKFLHIKTSGRDDTHSDQYRYPYEPTPYSVLERLAGSGYIGKKNTVFDYGCGKGRVDFFLSYQLRCHCIGVEYDERIYEAAERNRESAVSGSRVEFVQERAEEYRIAANERHTIAADEKHILVSNEKNSASAVADRFYFFNPFSVEILQKVISRIRESWDGREMLLFFYYPSNEYISYLMTVDELMFVDEIDCRDLFDGSDYRERIMVFKFGYETAAAV